MSETSEYNRLMEFWRPPATQALVIKSFDRGSIGVTRTMCNVDGWGLTDEHEIEDAVVVSLQLKRIFADVFLEERHVPVPDRSDGKIVIADLRQRWAVDVQSSFDSIHFHVPLSVVEEAGMEHRGDVVRELRAYPGECIDDPAVRALGLALLRPLEAPRQPSTLFLDYIGWALTAHLVRSYGVGGRVMNMSPHGLADWQVRRAKELIDADLSGNVRLADLAASCRLSVSHFARAFKQSTGLSPHNWLLLRRVERATHLMRWPDMSLAEVAVASGFSDQAHLTRIFRRTFKTTPGEWRRAEFGSTYRARAIPSKTIESFKTSRLLAA